MPRLQFESKYDLGWKITGEQLPDMSLERISLVVARRIVVFVLVLIIAAGGGITLPLRLFGLRVPLSWPYIILDINFKDFMMGGTIVTFISLDNKYKFFCARGITNLSAILARKYGSAISQEFCLAYFERSNKKFSPSLSGSRSPMVFSQSAPHAPAICTLQARRLACDLFQPLSISISCLKIRHLESYLS